MSSCSPIAVFSGLLLFLLFSIINKSCEGGDRTTGQPSPPSHVAAHKSYATPVLLYYSQYYSGMFSLLFCLERRRGMTSALFTPRTADPFPDSAFNVYRSLSGRSSRRRIGMAAKGQRSSCCPSSVGVARLVSRSVGSFVHMAPM